ncbi:MAG: YjbH domain-containing protein [Chlorobiales bacterium]|jgi:hypothetical protein|nr:YjbH domain-containing protein [Chlorobiales bacterium]
MKKTSVLLAVLCNIVFSFSTLQAQGTAGTEATEESRYLFNMPTAGVLSRGSYAVEGWVFPGGGALLSLSVGIADKLTFGASYGAANLIGTGSPEWNDLPGVMVRYRIIEEESAFPAIAIGFDSQGRDGYIQGNDRYVRKSPGFFAVASKNFELLGFITWHGGINYSLENKDDKDINFYFGVEKTIGSEITMYAQYDAAVNDNAPSALGGGHGFLDLGLRWSIGKGITVEMNLTNVSDNLKEIDSAGRSVRLEYIRHF